MIKNDKVYLTHIIESIEIIEKFVNGYNKLKFKSDLKTQDSVIRRLEIIGEAVKSLSKKILLETKHIPWSDIAKTRDKLIHGYFSVDLDLVWGVVKYDLQPLKKEIKKLLLKL